MSFSHEETWRVEAKNYGHGVSTSLRECDHVYLEVDDAHSV